MKQNSKATTYALLSVLLWSTVATAFKLGLTFSALPDINRLCCFATCFFYHYSHSGQNQILIFCNHFRFRQIGTFGRFKSIWLLPHFISGLQPFTRASSPAAQYDLARYTSIALCSTTETKDHCSEHRSYSRQLCWCDIYFVTGKYIRHCQYQFNRCSAGCGKQRDLGTLLDFERSRQTR